MGFQSRSTNPNKLVSAVRRRPFAFFGLPFLGIVVVSSFGLQTLTQTRYDLDNQKVQAVSKEEELGMSKERKKVDIREEYYVSRKGMSVGGGG
jgi:cytochrome c oxidase assembly protein subunit 16